MGPLFGIRIIEIAGLGPGPFCAMMLADNGAEVIRVGRPDEAPDARKDILNRSRRSIPVDLKSVKGKEVVKRLCRSAHGLIEGFRPGVMERLGLGPEVLLKENAGLIYGRMTGFGQTGPYRGMAGHDLNYISLSGALGAIGRAGEAPVPPLNLVGDFGGGGLLLAFGMVSALLHAQKTGKGQVIDCAMTEGSAALMAAIYSMRAQGKWRDRRGANMVDGGAPYYDAYETSDGKYISLGPVEPQFYSLMLQLIGLDGQVSLADQHREEEWPRVKRVLQDRIRTKTRDEWCVLLEGTDACFSPVMTIDEAPDHIHNKAREAFVELEGVVQPAPVPRYSGTPTVSPAFMAAGDDVSADVLREAGFSADEIAELRADRIVA